MKKIFLTIAMVMWAFNANAADVTYADKSTGNSFTAADANEIKTAVNSKENTGVAQGLLDTHETTHPAPTTRDARNQVAGNYVETSEGTTLSPNAETFITAADYAAMRTALGVYSMTAADAAFQPLAANLTSWAAIAPSAKQDTITGTYILPDGVTATTQTAGDNSTKLATTAYVGAAVGAAGGMSTTDIDTSGEIATIVGDETGTGALVFATSPALVTPDLGTPSAVNLANATFPTTIPTAPASLEIFVLDDCTTATGMATGDLCFEY
jgi:hypothetical protein